MHLKRFEHLMIGYSHNQIQIKITRENLLQIQIGRIVLKY